MYCSAVIKLDLDWRPPCKTPQINASNCYGDMSMNSKHTAEAEIRVSQPRSTAAHLNK